MGWHRPGLLRSPRAGSGQIPVGTLSSTPYLSPACGLGSHTPNLGVNTELMGHHWPQAKASRPLVFSRTLSRPQIRQNLRRRISATLTGVLLQAPWAAQRAADTRHRSPVLCSAGTSKVTSHGRPRAWFLPDSGTAQEGGLNLPMMAPWGCFLAEVCTEPTGEMPPGVITPCDLSQLSPRGELVQYTQLPDQR